MFALIALLAAGAKWVPFGTGNTYVLKPKSVDKGNCFLILIRIRDVFNHKYL